VSTSPNRDVERIDNPTGRIASAFERIAVALEKIAGIEDKTKPRKPAVIERPSDEKKEQFSDRADPEWIEETERTASRFRERFDSTKAGDKT
jgi:hypothetical protein